MSLVWYLESGIERSSDRGGGGIIMCKIPNYQRLSSTHCLISHAPLSRSTRNFRKNGGSKWELHNHSVCPIRSWFPIKNEVRRPQTFIVVCILVLSSVSRILRIDFKPFCCAEIFQFHRPLDVFHFIFKEKWKRNLEKVLGLTLERNFSILFHSPFRIFP